MEFLDLPIIDKFNAIGGSLVVVASYLLGDHYMLFLAFLFLNVIDYVTGVMKSKLLNNECSSAGLKGIIKKFSYWVMVMLSFVMGSVLNEVGETIGADFSAFTPAIGWFTLATLSINELRSILENLVEAGIYVPAGLIKGLKVATHLLNKQEELFDGSIDITAHENDEYHVELKTPEEELKSRNTVTLRIKTLPDDAE